MACETRLGDVRANGEQQNPQNLEFNTSKGTPAYARSLWKGARLTAGTLHAFAATRKLHPRQSQLKQTLANAKAVIIKLRCMPGVLPSASHPIGVKVLLPSFGGPLNLTSSSK